MRLANYLILLLATAFIVSCTEETKPDKTEKKAPVVNPIVVPEFNQDSAYRYVQEQVNFGPRVPGTVAHAQCAIYLSDKLNSFGAQVINQDFKTRSYDGKVLSGINIIGSYNPDARKRVLLCAHWDSRHLADHDDDPDNYHHPIDGANDGASGVGVLLEIARQLQSTPIDIGIDIILFDIEDYGQPSNDTRPQIQDSWCLGSQYWARTPHKPGYRANYGILLDMVGGKDLVLTKEYHSVGFAKGIVNKIWAHAYQLGYSNVFLDVEAGAVLDDHYYINKYAGIPTVDLIHYVEGSSSGFFPHWHTQNDNMEAIDAGSLRIVGHVVLDVIYKEK